jgi:hypothetical protein
MPNKGRQPALGEFLALYPYAAKRVFSLLKSQASCLGSPLWAILEPPLLSLLPKRRTDDLQFQEPAKHRACRRSRRAHLVALSPPAVLRRRLPPGALIGAASSEARAAIATYVLLARSGSASIEALPPGPSVFCQIGQAALTSRIPNASETRFAYPPP